MECSKNKLGVKTMKKKKGVKRRENIFDSKDDCLATHISSLKTSKLENFYFRIVVDLFENFPLTAHLPDSDI